MSEATAEKAPPEASTQPSALRTGILTGLFLGPVSDGCKATSGRDSARGRPSARQLAQAVRYRVERGYLKSAPNECSMAQVREALESLEGSLVKRVRQATKQRWQVHHPSMIEALQQELASKSSQLSLYLQGALLPAILRDTTALPPAADSRLVFLPETVYPILCARLSKGGEAEADDVAAYLADRASDALLLALDATDRTVLDELLSVVPRPDGAEGTAKLAVRLSRVTSREIFAGDRQERAKRALLDAVDESGWLGFVEIDGLRHALPGFLEECLGLECDQGFPCMEKLFDWYTEDLPAEALSLEGLETQVTRLADSLVRLGISTPKDEEALAGIKTRLQERVEGRQAEAEERDDYGDYYYELSRDDPGDGRDLGDRFADVDE
jgi:hypothetical protein